jgi:hypothetical protein
MNKEFTFGGITVFQLDDMSNKLECVYDDDDEILLLTTKTYRHREENLNFDYKYGISAFNMMSITDDEQFTEDNAFDVSIYLIVSPTSLDKELKEDIKKSIGGYCDYQDIYSYGLGVRLLNDNHSMNDIEEFIYKVGNVIKTLDNLRGFFLDKPMNKIGSTGWDMIFNCLDGESYITRALERW